MKTFFLIFIFYAVTIFSQQLILKNTPLPVNQKLQLELKSYTGADKNEAENTLPWYVSLGEIAVTNLGVWAYDRYALEEPFSYIDPNTIKHNLDTSFVWDKDKFHVNQFLHPFHGSIYFNWARTSGKSFFNSIPFAFLGSLMWELFMEKDPPSKNDLLSTTMGGVMLGEMAYRTSNLILHRNPCNLFSSFAASIISFPTLLINYGARGIQKDNNLKYDSAYSLRVSAGVSITNNNHPTNPKYTVNPYVQIYYTYGKAGKNEFLGPYEYFRFRAGMSFGAKAPYNFVYAHASLFGVKYDLNTNLKQSLTLLFFQDYDFIHNKARYEIGAQSIGPGAFFRTHIPHISTDFFASAHINFILLGALKSYRVNGDQDYDFGNGLKAMGEMDINISKKVRLYLENRFFWTWNVQSRGHHLVNIFDTRIIFENIIKGSFAARLGVGGELISFYGKQWAESKFSCYNIVKTKSTENRIFVTCRF